VGRVVAAAHMAWGAANELLTLNGYRLLAASSAHPVLRDLLDRIAAQEARHYSFYLLQAQWRLADSALVRAVVPRVVARAWSPVGIGAGYKTSEEFGHVAQIIARNPDGRSVVDRMDRRMAQLPGFGSLAIYRGAMTAALA
jgi:hypothetical protein